MAAAGGRALGSTIVGAVPGANDIQLVAGDTMEIYVGNSAARALSVGNTVDTFFSGHLISKT